MGVDLGMGTQKSETDPNRTEKSQSPARMSLSPTHASTTFHIHPLLGLRMKIHVGYNLNHVGISGIGTGRAEINRWQRLCYEGMGQDMRGTNRTAAIGVTGCPRHNQLDWLMNVVEN